MNFTVYFQEKLRQQLKMFGYVGDRIKIFITFFSVINNNALNFDFNLQNLLCPRLFKW